jgi:16S rRNA (adenine1518-N6/adenine1519-N6)-dimethyltransferase
MDLTSPKFIKNLLKKYGIRPFKGWGQNFLIDRSVLRKIIESAELKKSDIVLEIGPGIGTLTQELAKKAKKVIAVEKDKKMVEILKETLKGIENVKVIQGDILKIPNSQFIIHNSYKIVANLPYYIVSPVIRKFLELTEVRPLQMILMVQKEVAQRICAKPPNMNLLAVSVQFYSKPEILFYVSKNSFWPQPKVNGAVIKIVPRKLQRTVLCKLFFKIVKAGFCQPRKQLVNNLSKMLKLDKEKVKNWLLKNGIQPSQRAETLSVNDWLKLTKNFKWKKR